MSLIWNIFPTESFPPTINQRSGNQRATAINIAQALDCSTETDRDILKCLQNVAAEKILEETGSIEDAQFHPTIDFTYDIDTPFFYTSPLNAFYKGIYNKVPLMAGFNKESGIAAAAKYIKNQSLLVELNENWDIMGSQEIFKKCYLIV